MAFNPQDDLQKLIQQQSKFISGVTPTNTRSTSVPVSLSSSFQPTLDEMLRTGRPVDTAGIGKAAEMDATRFFRDQSADINQAAAAGGLTQSSAQTASLARALSDLSQGIGAETLRAGVNAKENAANRSQGSLGDAIAAFQAQSNSFLTNRGLDQGQAQLDLSGRTQQAGAGQSLIDSLLRSLPQFSNNKLSAGGNTNPFLNQPKKGTGVSQITVGRPKTLQEKIFDQLQASLRSLKTPVLPGGLMTTVPEYLRSQAQGAKNTRLQDILSAAFAGSPFSGQQADAQSMAAFRDPSAGAIGSQVVAGQNQNSQNQFMNDLARRFGPAFAGLGR